MDGPDCNTLYLFPHRPFRALLLSPLDIEIDVLPKVVRDKAIPCGTLNHS